MIGEGASAGLFGSLPSALVASVLAAVMASIGILTVSVRTGWAERYRPILAALASGVLLSTALFILPEAFSGSSLGPLATLGGYFLLFLIGRLARRPAGRAFAAFFAISLHSTIDGLEYGLLFAADTTAGVLGATGLIVHEFSEGVILFLILRTAGTGKFFAAVLALIGAALTTPLGTIGVLMVIPELSTEVFSLSLAFAAGALLFVGASQLPEEFGDLGFRPATVAYAVGALLAVVLYWISHGLGHESHFEHEAEEGEHHDLIDGRQ